MAFEQEYFYKSSAGFGRANVNQYHTYKTDDDTAAEVKASGYFDKSVPALEVDDLVYISAKDGRELLYVAGVDPVTTADLVAGGSAVVPDGSITTAKLADGAVTQGKLASQAVDTAEIKHGAIDPTKLADSVGFVSLTFASFATVGASSDVFTVPTASVSDFASAYLKNGFSVGINGIVLATNQVTVHYSGNAATGDLVQIILFKKAL